MTAHNAKVFTVKHRDLNRWRIRLEYEDGEVYMSRKIYDSEDEAKKDAWKWINEMVEQGAALRQ